MSGRKSRNGRKWSRPRAPKPSERRDSGPRLERPRALRSSASALPALERRQLPEVRLRVRQRRQGPGAGAHRPDIAIDGNLDQIGAVGLDRGFEHALEVAGALDAGGLDSEGSLEHREVRTVELAGLVFPEARRQLLAEHAELH